MSLHRLVVALIALSLALAAPDMAAARGATGRLRRLAGLPDSLLGPDAFFATADAATHRLTGLGLTYGFAGCFEGSSTPVTLRVDRTVQASTLAAGTVPPPNTLATGSRRQLRILRSRIHPDAGGGRTEVRISGRIGARKAAGSARATTFSSTGTPTCDTGPRRWRATRDPGRIFAGSVPETGTIALTRDEKLVRVFHATVWMTRCAGGQAWLVPNVVVTGGADIPNGRFSRPVDDTPAGLGVTASYTIAGRIGARARPRACSEAASPASSTGSRRGAARSRTVAGRRSLADDQPERTSWAKRTTSAPSPTAPATRLEAPARTSPAANTPGRTVSTGAARDPLSGQFR